mgnify:FL=1
MENLKIIRREVLKEKPDQKHLGFGKYFTDHMFTMDYTEGKGWHDPMIVPYGPIELEPSAMVLHYGLESFEGMKAYRAKDGRILIYRPEKNAERLINTHRRLCMPEIPVDLFVDAVNAIVSYERDWVPSEPETSLYIRPFCIATEAALGKDCCHVVMIRPAGGIKLG